MGRRRKHPLLRILLNNRLVGYFSKQSNGATTFTYDETWLSWEHAIPVSLSLPLREDPYHGAEVTAVFENLLPDNIDLRTRVAENVGAEGIDAYSLLAAIGRDCVGALQFIAGEEDVPKVDNVIQARPIDELTIEKRLNNLVKTPLGLERDDDFRISIAGAQEKTALLWHEDRWKEPLGTTATTHLFKTQIGHLPYGIDLSNSIENEFYCLKLFEAMGMRVNKAEIQKFGNTKALVVERFDRQWTSDGRLLRIPQEDCCQALSIPPTRKYQSEGGPGLADILKLLKGTDHSLLDQAMFIKAQLVFFLIGATDGHAKNFSIFLKPGGGYSLTPFYDIMTAQPSLDAGQITRRQMKLAMSVGKNRHYRLEEIFARHFIQTGSEASVSSQIIEGMIEETIGTIDKALEKIERLLPGDFPEEIHTSVKAAINQRKTQLILRPV